MSAEFVAWAAQASAQTAFPAATLEERRRAIDAALGGAPLAPGTETHDIELGGVPAIECRRSGHRDEPVLVWFHGGGYRVGSAVAYRPFGTHLAAACEARVVMADYSLAPERPFPHAVDDALAVCRAAVALGAPLAVGGDSAGGGLAVAAAAACRDAGVEIAGIACASPWADLANTSETYSSRAGTDRLFSLEAANEAAALYLGDHDRRDPRASPVNADLSGLGPMLALVSDAEVLLGDATRLAERARTCGVDVRLHVYEEMPHCWLLNHPHFPEATDAVVRVGAFVRSLGG